MFGRSTLVIRSLCRAANPQDANIKQRSGPSHYAIAAAVIGVGAGYMVWDSKMADDAKTPKQDELKRKETVKTSGGGASKI